MEEEAVSAHNFHTPWHHVSLVGLHNVHMVVLQVFSLDVAFRTSRTALLPEKESRVVCSEYRFVCQHFLWMSLIETLLFRGSVPGILGSFLHYK
jgi:hypothetical protein